MDDIQQQNGVQQVYVPQSQMFQPPVQQNVVQMPIGQHYQPVHPVVPQMVQPVNMSKAMRITSVDDLANFNQGTVVRLPDFDGNTPFVARLRRPSMLALAKFGKIPNSLLATASDLFQNGGAGVKRGDDNLLADLYDVCKVVCRAALVEPTLDDLEAAGIELTDQQVMVIFNFTQTGVTALHSFREE